MRLRSRRLTLGPIDKYFGEPDVSTNQMTQQIPYPHLLSNHHPEAEPLNLTQKTDEKKIEMTMEDVKSKIEVLENQIKQMKKIDTGKLVCFSDLYVPRS